MKKLLLAILVVASLVTSAFATEVTKVNYLTQKSFETEFEGASDVSWTSTANYVKANFVYEDQRMEAFYNSDGEKIGTTKAIALDLLPVKAKRAFAKKYSAYEVKESIVFNGAYETAYFISAKNEKQSLVVKVYENGETSIYSKL